MMFTHYSSPAKARVNKGVRVERGKVYLGLMKYNKLPSPKQNKKKTKQGKRKRGGVRTNERTNKQNKRLTMTMIQ
jgi:hypothetical protein